MNNISIEGLLNDVYSYGDLLVVANKGIGKTNMLMILAKKLRENSDNKVIIMEDFPNWCLKFDKIPYMIVRDEIVEETKGNYGQKEYVVNNEDKFIESVENNKDFLFTMEISDIERSAYFIYEIVKHFYRKQYIRKYRNFNSKQRIIFIIEESQNVFDSSVINKRVFNRLRKIFAVSRNLNIHFIMASQRLQDLNTKIRGRCRLLIGQVSLDDYELKIRRLLRHSKYNKQILTFDRGKFLYPALDSVIEFPLFNIREE